jgi:hypothetical protein
MKTKHSPKSVKILNSMSKQNLAAWLEQAVGVKRDRPENSFVMSDIEKQFGVKRARAGEIVAKLLKDGKIKRGTYINNGRVKVYWEPVKK